MKCNPRGIYLLMFTQKTAEGQMPSRAALASLTSRGATGLEGLWLPPPQQCHPLFLLLVL